jgi:hypothetical protein
MHPTIALLIANDRIADLCREARANRLAAKARGRTRRLDGSPGAGRPPGFWQRPIVTVRANLAEVEDPAC